MSEKITVLGIEVTFGTAHRQELNAHGHCYVEVEGPKGHDLILIERIWPGYGVMSYHHGSTLTLSIKGL